MLRNDLMDVGLVRLQMGKSPDRRLEAFLFFVRKTKGSRTVHYKKGVNRLEKNHIAEKINREIKADLVADTLLQALKHKYQRIYQHCVNVAISAYWLGLKMDLPEAVCLQIGIGGMLHDIGKLNIPSKILYKPGQLTQQEEGIIKRHPSAGISLLNQSRLLSGCAPGIRFHHERIDGKGYGQGLSDQAIPLEARIIAVCDAFDRMVSSSWLNHKTLTVREATEAISRGSGSQFDPTVAQVFLQMADQLVEMISSDSQTDQSSGKEIVSAKAGTAIDWEMMLDDVDHLGVIFVDQNDTIAYCNQASAVIRKREKTEIIGTQFGSFHKKHRHEIVNEKLNAVKSGQSSGWSRIMKRGDTYIANEYIGIRNQEAGYQGLLMLSRDVTEKENMLRMMEKDIENLNILIQSNGLLTEIFSMDEIYKKAWEVFKQAVEFENMSVILNKQDVKTVYDQNESGKGVAKDWFDEIVFDPRNPSYQQLVTKDLLRTTKLIWAYQLDHQCQALIVLEIEKGSQLDPNLVKILTTIGSYVINAIQKSRLIDEIRENARIDNLTQVFNREYYQMMLDSIDTQKENVGVIVADIDNLKFYNDTYGHLFGDEVIKKTAGILKSTIRNEDYLFRIGGDEFLILLRNCSEEDALNTCRRIQKNINKHQVEPVKEVKLGISVGFHTSNKAHSINEVIKIADENMYRNKREGKYMRGVN